MNSHRRVSVVVPSYNSAAYISETIDSILAQTFDDFDLFISDHSSTDGTWEALQAYRGDPRVHLTRLPTGGGAPANWQAVTALGTGELIKLVCGDDLIHPTCLAEQVAAYDEHPGAVLVASSRNIIDSGSRVLISGRGLACLRGRVAGSEAVRRTVRSGVNIFGEPGCVLMNRAALEAAGGWDDSFPYLIDQATYCRVLLGKSQSHSDAEAGDGSGGDLIAIPHPLAGFRLSSEQWSVALARSQSAQARGFHRWVATKYPGVLSRVDLRLGNAMAVGMSLARRGFSMVMRMRAQG